MPIYFLTPYGLHICKVMDSAHPQLAPPTRKQWKEIISSCTIPIAEKITHVDRLKITAGKYRRLVSIYPSRRHVFVDDDFERDFISHCQPAQNQINK